MKRRSFLATFAALPFASKLVLGKMPSIAEPLYSYGSAPKIISFKCTTSFELSPILTLGKLEMYEDINEPPKVELAVGYDDGSVRNFTCDNKKWSYETRDHEHEVIIDGDTITYRRPSNIAGDHLSCVCTFKNVKESFGLKIEKLGTTLKKLTKEYENG
jgi:hypothetical protein